MMKILISILSLLIILTGLLPFLGSNGLGLLPESIPTSGLGYQLTVIFVGVAGLLYAILNQLLFGIEKFVTGAIALLTILGGVLPFDFIASFLPFSIASPIYPLIIIVIGAIGLVYGIIGVG